jgi:hypothetical protein
MPFPASLTQTLTTFRAAPYPSVTGLPQAITFRSIAEFAFAIVWACIMLVSFAGWGRYLGKLVRVQRLPASVACALGIAVVILVGGWLNLLHVIYSGVLIGFIGIGVVLYLAARDERPDNYRWSSLWVRAPGWSRMLIVLTLVVLVFRVAATVRLATYHNYDDGTAYLAFPQKMLDAHQFAPDPFSDRRIISSLGGSYLLQTIIIVATSLANVGMADRTLGLLLMLVAIYDLGTIFNLSPQRLAVMGLLAYLVPQETFNLTFCVLPISLLLGMMWAIYATFDQEEVVRWRYAALAGAVGGGLLCLKSTFLPYIGAVALFPYLTFLWKESKKEALKLPLIAGCAALTIAFPWMVAMRHESGTLLFPLLGHGFDYSSYGLFPHLANFSGTRAVVRVFVQGAVLLILAAVQYFADIRDRRSRFSFTILCAAAFAITAFNYESGGDYIWRYNFPQFFTAILVFFAATGGAGDSSPCTIRVKIVHVFAMLSLVACIFYYDIAGGHPAPFSQMTKQMFQYPCRLRASLSAQPLVSPDVQARYRAIEDTVPPDSTSLDDTAKTYLLLDRGGKRFLIDDWPGAAGPPPGWPYSKNPEAVTEYLKRNSVRYIVYDYAYAEWVDMQSCQALVNQSHFSQLDHALELMMFVAHHQFSQLRAAHHSIYDDGKIAVVDLASPVAPASNGEGAWTLHTSEAKMCAHIAHRYMTAHASYPVMAKGSSCQ